MKEKTVYLVLENGKVFSGYSFGAVGETIGEIAITTSMVGYIETLTDPAYLGQIVVQTFPSIGNYGVMASDMESDTPALNAYIVREWCQEPSNFRCEGDLDTFLKAHGVVGVYGIDTRELTRLVRANGVMNAKITTDISDVAAIQEELSGCEICNAVEIITTTDPKVYPAEGEPVAKVAALDLGTKMEFIRALTSRGCEVTLLPAETKAETIKKEGYDGVFLTSGPGDPSRNIAIVQTIQTLLEAKLPIFGIGLGHQLLALAHDAQTVKMPYGHRGGSQPSLEIGTPRIHTTPQNHGYTVAQDTLPANARVTYKNVNDGDCEGIVYDGENAFSVQFYPTRDTAGEYDRFVKMMTGGDL